MPSEENSSYEKAEGSLKKFGASDFALLLRILKLMDNETNSVMRKTTEKMVALNKSNTRSERAVLPHRFNNLSSRRLGSGSTKNIPRTHAEAYKLLVNTVPISRDYVNEIAQIRRN